MQITDSATDLVPDGEPGPRTIEVVLFVGRKVHPVKFIEGRKCTGAPPHKGNAIGVKPVIEAGVDCLRVVVGKGAGSLL